ncbi:MAG: HEAT repeat domain-containing protein, partial [Lysobacter sp.]|nr:HEAT repeat domain-containing protein [Lysobacter sp.]
MRAFVKAKDPSKVEHWNAAGVLLKRVVTFDGAQARLVALLSDPDKRMATLASMGLAEGGPVDPQYLPQIVAGLDRRLYNLPIALGSIHTDEAARHAVRYYVDTGAHGTGSAAAAITRLGELAVPHIVQATRDSPCCDRHDTALRLAELMRELDEKGASAAPALMAIAEDPAVSDVLAESAVLVMWGIQKHANAMGPRLLALRTQRPALAESIDQTLVDIGAPSGAILTRRLAEADEENRRYVLWDIVHAGAMARDAGPALLPLLDEPDPDVRRATVSALAAIGYTEATDAMIGLLDDPQDVIVNWLAADALGRWQSKQAVPALERIAEKHWYPAAREVALRSIEEIRTGVSAERNNWEAQGTMTPTCEVPDVRIAEPGRSEKLEEERDTAALKKLQYVSTIVGYGASEDTEPVDGIIHVTSNNVVRTEEIVQQTPSVALRVDGGWVAGADRGEWGGDLVYIGDDGVKQTFFENNIQGLGRIGDRIVAASGIAHLTLNEGSLFDVRRGDDGRWIATPWRGLPGAPWDLLRV